MGLYDLEKTKFMKLDIQRFAAALELDCDESGVSISNNTSNVWVTITAKRTSGSTFWDDEKKGTVECDGESKSFYLSLPSNKSSNSTEVKFSNIEHDSDGSKTVKVSASITPGSSIGELYKSTRFKLTDIPRHAKITAFNVFNIAGFDGLNQLGLSYSTDVPIDAAWYSTDNGVSWADLPATWRISGLQPNTGYNVKIRVRRADNQLTTDSNSIYIATLPVAYITSGTPNVTNGQALRVTANNPSGAKCRFDLQVPIGTTRIIKSGTDITFSVEEINSMMQYINSPTSRIRVYVTNLNDAETVYYNSYVDGNYSIVNSNPTFNYFEFEDINPKTIALTGNNQNCILGYSSIKATIPVANKAIANNYATMTKYRLSIGQNSVDANYSNNADVSMTLNNAQTGTFTVYAIDSRNLSTPVTLLANNVINYFNIRSNNDIIANRVNDSGETVGNSEKVKVKFSGYIFKGDFGVKENAIKGFTYRYRVTSSNTWSEWLNLNTNLITVDSTGKFTFDSLIKGDVDEGFNEANAYTIEFSIADELSWINYQVNISGGIPHLAWHPNGLSVMGKYNTQKGGPFQIQGIPINELIGQNSISLNDLKKYISNGTLMNELRGLGTYCFDISNQDLNTACNDKNGFYMGYNLTNSPNGTDWWFYIMNLSHNNLYSFQIAYNFNLNLKWTRYKNGGNWSPWYRVGNGTVLWSGSSNDVYVDMGEYNSVEVFVNYTGHNTEFTSGKRRIEDLNKNISFYEAGTTTEYYCRVTLYNGRCVIADNWEKTLGSSHWGNTDSWKIVKIIAYKE